MNNKWMLAPVFCCLALSACQKTPDTSVSLKPLDAKKSHIKSAPQYYPVPAYHGKQLEGAPASTLPPGQDLAPIKRLHRHHTIAPQAPVASPIIKVPMSIAWVRVEKALSKTHYKIMDKDSSLHTFYVLDRSRTKGRLTRQTPMYRIQLVQQKTAVMLDVSTSDQSELPVAVRNALLNALSKHL